MSTQVINLTDKEHSNTTNAGDWSNYCVNIAYVSADDAHRHGNWPWFVKKTCSNQLYQPNSGRTNDYHQHTIIQ